MCIHPKFNSTPYNIFNLPASTGYVFKSDVEVLVNNEYNPEYLSLLKHTSILGQTPFFLELSENKVSIEITIKKTIVGSTKFNVIEIDPFLSGSFNIDNIELYSLDDYNLNIDTPTYTIDNIAGIPQRLILNNSINLYKAKFNITILNQNKAGKYPIGFKNIYFLNADFNESYLVTTLHQPKFIRQIDQNIIIRNQLGRYNSLINDEGIRFYLECNDNELEYEIATESDILNNTFPKNTKDVYVYIPIKTTLIYIDFIGIVLDEG